MSRLHFFIILFSICSVFCNAQNSEFSIQNEKKTDKWEFICENYALDGKTTIQISKEQKGGFLFIEVESTDLTHYIGGTIYVYLSDFSFLTCTDKQIRSVENSKIKARYAFTESEMKKLRNIDIASIRFNIRGKQKLFGSQIGNFSAVNKKTYFSSTGKKTETYNTSKQIDLLF